MAAATGCETVSADTGGRPQHNDDPASRQRRSHLAPAKIERPPLPYETVENAPHRPPPRRHPGSAIPSAAALCHAARVPKPTRELPTIEFKGYQLNEFQVEAALAIEAGKNVLLAAPTGSGKTLVAEYAVSMALRSGRRAIYTSPIKALSNQKFRDFKQDGLHVGLMTGDLTLDPDAPLVIMTTEIFRNAVFEDPERFRDTEFAIFDEVHFVDDVERGTVWEESLIFAPEHVRFVGLSATIDNLHEFGNWVRSVRKHELAVIEHTRRPVPLSHRLFHPDAGVFQLPQRPRAITFHQRAAARDKRHGNRAGRRERERSRWGDKRERSRGRRIAVGPRPYVQLLDELQHRDLLPLLYFCFSRKECEIKAERSMGRRLLDKAQRQRVEELFRDICARFELDADADPGLRGILGRAITGVGYHHAGMLPIHKEVVERLFTSGLLRMLFTTETFALGINMPARTVVFDLLRKYDGVQMNYMKARDYLQMAGRAGRQGLDKSGLVISILEDEDLLEGPLSRYHSGKVEPITSRFNLSYSTILGLYDRLGSKGLLAAYDRSFAAFQAQKGSASTRQKKRAAAHAALSCRVNVLRQAGYLDDSGLLPRGKVAQRINGYEIQVAELLFAGVLEQMDMHQLAATFAALIHEERRRAEPRNHRKEEGPLMRAATDAVRRFIAIESLQGIEHPIKEPDFGIAAAVDAWSRGGTIESLERISHGDAGDIVRTLRMAIQMMRQVRITVGKNDQLGARLDEAIVAINRDEVDAKRQFELG
jgi:superfamily II RNA helicase